MLKKIGPNAVESSEGYSVRRLSRFELEYRIGDKRVVVEVEPGDGLAIYRQSMTHWETPAGFKSLSAEERERALTDIRGALEFLGTKYVMS